MRKVAGKQSRNWQKLLELASEHYREHGQIAEHELKKAATPEENEFVADMLRAWNRPWDLWEAEVLMRTTLQESKRKREAGIVSANTERQRKSGDAHRLYREVAQKLIAENPALGRVTLHRLAQKVQAELVRHGKRPVSTRTVRRAFEGKNKI